MLADVLCDLDRWPQETDDLLRDMSLPCMRSGGNWVTWPFKVLDVKEIEHLKEERDALRKLPLASSS